MISVDLSHLYLNYEFFHQETFQWNGITSKKKGQQWGKEDRPFIPRNDHKISNKEDSELGNEKETHVDEGADLDKLAPLLVMPKVVSYFLSPLMKRNNLWTSVKIDQYSLTKESLTITVSSLSLCRKEILLHIGFWNYHHPGLLSFLLIEYYSIIVALRKFFCLAVKSY